MNTRVTLRSCKSKKKICSQKACLLRMGAPGQEPPPTATLKARCRPFKCNWPVPSVSPATLPTSLTNQIRDAEETREGDTGGRITNRNWFFKPQSFFCTQRKKIKLISIRQIFKKTKNWWINTLFETLRKSVFEKKKSSASSWKTWWWSRNDGHRI